MRMKMKEVNNKKKRRELYGSEQLFAGAFSGAVNRMIVAPLDLLKVRFQIQSATMKHHHFYSSLFDATKQIIKYEGIFGFWKGNVAAQMMSTIYTATAFYTFHQARQTLQNLQSNDSDIKKQRAGPLVSIVAGSMSGMVATFVSYPFDLLRTRFAVQISGKPLYNNVSQAFMHIWNESGLVGYFRGLVPTTTAIVPYIALQFAFYNSLMNYYNKNNRTHQICGTPFVCGLVAGTLAKFTTMPLDVIKKRIQVDGFDGRKWDFHSKKGTIRSVVRHIIVEDGLKGFFRGSVITLLKAAPSSAITFSAYEACADFLARD